MAVFMEACMAGSMAAVYTVADFMGVIQVFPNLLHIPAPLVLQYLLG